MSLFTSMYTGVSGLTTSQVGINTSAHNLANVNTEGYVRQQISYADSMYSKVGTVSNVGSWQVGLGVVASETRHIRDLLLDKAYREQAGRENYYSVQYETTTEVENIMGELNGEAFQDTLKDLWDALSESAKAPDSNTTRAGIIMYADEFVTRVNAISDQLSDYQQNLDVEVEDTVNRINTLADTIYSLNLKIQGIEVIGTEGANDLRDQRDNALDELSELINITYDEDEKGFVTVRAEGQEFIMLGGVFHMATERIGTSETSGFLTPVWPQLDNAEVFYLDTEICTSKGNDVGLLKGLIQARGDRQANYTDIPHEPEFPDKDDYTDENGNFDQTGYEAAVETYRDDYNTYLKDTEIYNYGVGASVIMKTQAMLDQLVNSVVSIINDTLCPNVDKTISAGTTLTIGEGTNLNCLDDGIKAAIKAQYPDLQLSDTGNFLTDISVTLTGDVTVSALDTDMDARSYDGSYGEALFTRADSEERYTLMTDTAGNEYYVYNPNNSFGNESLYSIGNLALNQEILSDSSKLPFWNAEGESNYPMLKEILEKWDTASMNLDPNNLTKKDINDYYTAMTDVLANDGYVFKEISENQQSVVNTLDSSRESITGVASEEELTNLIKFQNAFNASSRYINAIAEMIDTIINRMAV